MSFASNAVLILLIATVVATVALQVGMFVKDKPFYGAVSIFILGGPGFVLTFIYVLLGVG